MPRYKLTVAYEGTDFHGWQKQEPPDASPLRTVQGVLEEAVRFVVREPVFVTGASRTDTGVHARGQVAAFTSEQKIPVERLPRAITSRLPADVQVRRAEMVPDDFDPIADCMSKGYRYRLAHGCADGGRVPLFDRRTTSWTAYALDLEAMKQAASRLIGEHDFAAFTRVHHDREHTVRSVHECAITPLSTGRLKLDISGSGFLHNMIRIIMGTLIEVGRGKLAPSDIDRIIASKDRTRAGTTFTPEGLCLMWVRYGKVNGEGLK